MNSFIVSESDAAPKVSPIQNPEVDSGPGFVRLKTKQKKLLRKALREGISRAKALRIVQATPVVRGLLRAPCRIKEIVNPTNRPNSSLDKSVRLGFASESDGTLLTTDQMSRIKEAIIDVTVEHSGSEMPQFEACVARRGWLMVICANFSTAQWLISNLCHIQTKVALKLKLMTEEELPRKNVIRGYFPDSLSTTNKKVLDIIEAQNPVSTKEWRVINRLIHGELLLLVMAVDNESQKKLVELDGIISFRFGRLKLSMKGLTDRNKLITAKEKTSTERQTPEKVPSIQSAAPVVEEPVMRNYGPRNYNNGPWNNCYGPWNFYDNPWTRWDQPPNFRYGPPNPSNFFGPGFWTGTDRLLTGRPPWHGDN
ncbi:uncharacterized protein LOC108148916 [Drosophila elegans]|uniref:uncharacterized protein LOC108148916 n=1 Tax=Drosophila elegans TaxID=30023 RepID=UPI0007E5E4E4|nr:uncharacterized protein LOC108148916 [Drosophila elegans]